MSSKLPQRRLACMIAQAGEHYSLVVPVYPSSDCAYCPLAANVNEDKSKQRPGRQFYTPLVLFSVHCSPIQLIRCPFKQCSDTFLKRKSGILRGILLDFSHQCNQSHSKGLNQLCPPASSSLYINPPHGLHGATSQTSPHIRCPGPAGGHRPRLL
jgi:hypothetical protein